ncbi:interferon-induced transmembrane protein 1-like [Anarhichas minor]|uniref:interferon-induced transmembrane protein 1-like n=1 Tax=Anarhichas minor TaxID=65739 RepID=UPI003F732E90
MNPVSYPTENVPLQGKNDGYPGLPGYPGPPGYPGQPGQPGQPGGPTVVQNTTVNIASEAPRDHVIWSIFNFVHLNPFCLGLAALIFSIKARDRKMGGDMSGARHYGSTARCLNIWATVLSCLLSLIFISAFIFMVVKTNQVVSHFRNYGRNNFGG